MNYNNVQPITATIDGKEYKFRSRSEFLFAVAISANIKKGNDNDTNTPRLVGFEYEPKVFCFQVPKRNKIKSYLPDFCLLYSNGTHKWVEIKGRLDAASRTKIRLFREQYPNEKLELLMTNSAKFLRYKVLAVETLKLKQKK